MFIQNKRFLWQFPEALLQKDRPLPRDAGQKTLIILLQYTAGIESFDRHILLRLSRINSLELPTKIPSLTI